MYAELLHFIDKIQRQEVLNFSSQLKELESQGLFRLRMGLPTVRVFSAAASKTPKHSVSVVVERNEKKRIGMACV